MVLLSSTVKQDLQQAYSNLLYRKYRKYSVSSVESFDSIQLAELNRDWLKIKHNIISSCTQSVSKDFTDVIGLDRWNMQYNNYIGYQIVDAKDAIVGIVTGIKRDKGAVSVIIDSNDSNTMPVIQLTVCRELPNNANGIVSPFLRIE